MFSKNTKSSNLIILCGICLMFVFIAFTVVVARVDVANIGPEQSSVGLSAFNASLRDAIGTSDLFYKISELLGYLAIALCGFFGIIGVLQLIKRKSLLKVDRDLLILGMFYIIVIALYVLFDKVIAINFRPVLEDGVLEASYPSSHTMLAIFVYITGIVFINRRLKTATHKTIVGIVLVLLTIALVATRILSGVHWATDIIGSVILASSLTVVYIGICARLKPISTHKKV